MHYIQKRILVRKIAENLEKDFDMDPRKIAAYLKSILKGIVSNDLVNRSLPTNNKKKYRYLEVCSICGKKKLKSLSRHMSISHPQEKKP